MARPIAVAITGGIGAGKSEALAAFARHGAAVISSDDIVHRLLQEDANVREALRERFGTRGLARLAALGLDAALPAGAQPFERLRTLTATLETPR